MKSIIPVLHCPLKLNLFKLNYEMSAFFKFIGGLGHVKLQLLLYTKHILNCNRKKRANPVKSWSLDASYFSILSISIRNP
jgi:hypothetical protein